jgi:ABC-type transport system involved in multi-copper enzyme maturation permease subunit
MIALIRRSAAQARYLLAGALTVLFGFQLIIVGQAAEIQRTQAFGKMADLLPGFLQRGMGSRALLLATFKGTVAFGYFHPLVCIFITVLAMYIGTEPAHEVEAGLVDIELSRPLARHRLLTRSLLLGAAAVTTALVLMFLGTSAGAWLFDAGALGLPSASIRLRLMLHLAGVAACFGGYALWLAAMSRRWSTAFTTAVLTALVLYLIDFLSLGWRPMRVFAWASPFHYYRALAIVAGDPMMWRDLGVLFGCGAGFVAAAYWRFSRRDL